MNPIGADDTPPMLNPGPAAEPTPEAPKPRGRRASTGAAKKAAAKKADTAPKGAGRPTKNAVLEKSLEDVFTNFGLAVAMVNEADGVAIIEGSGPLADSLASVAATNPRVARALERSTQAAGWGGVIIALSGILLPIAANHGLVPGASAGIGEHVEMNPDLMAAAQAMADEVMSDPTKMAAVLGGLRGTT